MDGSMEKGKYASTVVRFCGRRNDWGERNCESGCPRFAKSTHRIGEKEHAKKDSSVGEVENLGKTVAKSAWTYC